MLKRGQIENTSAKQSFGGVNNGVETENSNTMEIWRKMQIANVVLALVAVALTVAGFATAAMWAWSITLWVFMFLVPMPVIERNKKDNQIALALVFLLSVAFAAAINTWLGDYYPEIDSFSRGILIYSVAYTICALLFAAWLKIKEKKK